MILFPFLDSSLWNQPTMGKRWGRRGNLSKRLRGEDIYIHNSEFFQTAVSPPPLSTCMLNCFSCVQLFATPWLLPPWDSPGKSTGVGCHCLLGGLPDPGSNPSPSCLLRWQLVLHHQCHWQARVYLLIRPFTQIGLSCGLKQRSVTYLLLHSSATCCAD